MSQDEKKEIKVSFDNFSNEIREMFENNIQQHSGSQSNILKELKDIKERLTSVEGALSNWKFGTKVGFGIVVGVGGLVTWVLNTLGVNIGIK